jgi:3D (Asp-Asp-Asp) domain-containing protein
VAKTAAVSESKAAAGSLMGAFRATAYCLKGRTANGGSVRRGIVAADPRVLPLGSTIQISGGGYSGTYTVTDTGGAIKGRILDIWVPSCAEANRFGRRTITVTRLGKNKK